MDDVTGFNQKNAVNDGEKLVEQGLNKLRQRYSDHIIEIIRLMLKYDENERPSFVELAKLVLTSTENTIESPKNGVTKDGKKQVVGSKSVSKAFSQQSLKDKDQQNGAGAADRSKVKMINNRTESAKSNAYGTNQNIHQNINMSSAQPGEDGLLTNGGSAQSEAQMAQQ